MRARPGSKEAVNESILNVKPQFSEGRHRARIETHINYIHSCVFLCWLVAPLIGKTICLTVMCVKCFFVVGLLQIDGNLCHMHLRHSIRYTLNGVILCTDECASRRQVTCVAHPSNYGIFAIHITNPQTQSSHKCHV